MATLEAPPTTDIPANGPEGESHPEQEAPPPAVIRVPSRSFGGPVAYAMVGVPLLIASFAGSVLMARGLAGPPAAKQVAWSYEGATGPAQWGTIDPRNVACQTGQEQSPVDITPSRLMQVDWLSPLTFRYKPARQLRVVNDGQILHVGYERGSRLVHMGQEYELTGIQFHAPSEHTVNGRAADMEMQLMHTLPGASHRRAVLSVLVVEGRENQALAKFWEQIPQKDTSDPVVVNVEFNAQELVPQNTRFYTYSGSLTTPPCTEGVQWIVIKEAVPASRAQIQKIKDIFKPNARPVQPMKDRYVMEEVPPAR